MTKRELEQKTAVVAGASQGIGEAIARLFACEGARVVLLALDHDKVEAVAASIRADGGEALGCAMDVSDPAKWKALASVLQENGWGWHVLVNNAYWRTQTPVGDVSDDAWDRTMGVSLKGYFLGVRAAIPLMRQAGGGSIINISSLQSHIPEPNFGVYAVAKGGVDALSRVVARDYGPDIRANTIICGAVDTPGFAEGDDVKAELGRRLPLGRIARASEIAESALFLAGPRSSFITGTELIVDGGRSIT